MTNHMMIDLETLSTSHRSAVLQIGYCVFDIEAGSSEYQYQTNIDVDSCMVLGGEVSDHTVRWWLEQSPAARASVSAKGIPITAALVDLYQVYSNARCKAVWAHGSVFDIPIIEHYLQAAGMLAPWKYYEVMDTRTLFWLAKTTGWERPKRPTAHTALKDALVQAEDVCGAWNWVLTRVRG